MTPRERLDDSFPHIGFAAYFDRAIWRDPDRFQRIASLLVDPRWPWLPWWASFSGVDANDDRGATRVGGKNGATPLVEGFASPKLTTLRMNRTRGDGNFTSVRLSLGRIGEDWGQEAPFQLWLTCRAKDLPPGKSIDDWLGLAHELVREIGALHGTVGVWPTFNMAIADTWLTRIVLDSPKGILNLGLPEDFASQISKLQEWSKYLGRTYARHPRWGTYLNASHVAAIGGVDRVRSEVAPARIDQVGDLTYIQLTESVETALTPIAGHRRRQLEALMTPILVGAGKT